MIKVVGVSQYATFEQCFEDDRAEEAFMKTHELEEMGWQDVEFIHLAGLDLNKYYLSFLEKNKHIKIKEDK